MVPDCIANRIARWGVNCYISSDIIKWSIKRIDASESYIVQSFAHLLDRPHDPLQLVDSLDHVSKAIPNVPHALLPPACPQLLHPPQHLLQLLLGSPLLLQLGQQRLLGAHLGPIRLLKLSDGVLQLQKLFFALRELAVRLVLGQQDVLGYGEHAAHQQGFHPTRQLSEALLQEVQQFLGALAGLEAKLLGWIVVLRELSDEDGLHDQEHLVQAVLEGAVYPHHAGLWGETKKLRLIQVQRIRR